MTRSFTHRDIARDLGVEDKIAKYRTSVLLDLLTKIIPTIEHREDNTLDPQSGIGAISDLTNGQ